jgi:hypothetical protein
MSWAELIAAVLLVGLWLLAAALAHMGERR